MNIYIMLNNNDVVELITARYCDCLLELAQFVKQRHKELFRVAKS